MNTARIRRRLATIAVVLLVVPGNPGAATGSRADEANDPTAPPTAEAVLARASAFYKRAGTIAVRVEQKQDFGELKINSTWTIDYERPNRLRLQVNQAGLPVATAVSDGKSLSLLVASLRKYTVTPAPTAVGEIWKRLSDVLQVPFMQCVVLVPAAIDFCLSGPQEKDAGARARAYAYRGIQTINGTKAHHLRRKKDEHQWDLWIAADGDPVVKRAVLTIKNDAANAEEPDIEVMIVQDFVAWKFNEPPDAKTFIYQPRKGARKVERIVQEPNDLDGPHPLLDEPAPDVKLALVEKGDFRLEEHRGSHVVVLAFWATWCEACIEELPVLAELAARYKRQGVIVCGINSEPPDEVRPFLKEQKLDLSVAHDPESDVAGRYAVSAIPTLVLIDKKGVVRAVHVGGDSAFKATLERELDALVASKELPAQPAGAAR